MIVIEQSLTIEDTEKTDPFRGGLLPASVSGEGNTGRAVARL